MELLASIAQYTQYFKYVAWTIRMMTVFPQPKSMVAGKLYWNTELIKQNTHNAETQRANRRQNTLVPYIFQYGSVNETLPVLQSNVWTMLE